MDEQIDREDDQHADHQEALHEISPAGRPKAANDGVRQDDTRADQDADAIINSIEGRIERIARSTELRRDIQPHRGENDHDRQKAKHRHALVEVFGKKVRQRQSAEALGSILHWPRYDEPIEDEAQKDAGNNPIRRHTGAKRHAHQTERYPTRFTGRRGRQRRHPRPELAPRQEVIFISAFGEPSRVDPDGNDGQCVNRKRNRKDRHSAAPKGEGEYHGDTVSVGVPAGMHPQL